MEFKQIEAFVNVVKYKSFSRAADASFITQPTVSTHISSLEKELGVTLVERLGKESRPTKQGREFYKYALNLINTREKAIMAVGGSGQRLSESWNCRLPVFRACTSCPGLWRNSEKSIRRSVFIWSSLTARRFGTICWKTKGELGFTGDFRSNNLSYEILCRDSSVLITPKNEKFLALREKGSLLPERIFSTKEFVWREEGSATKYGGRKNCTEDGERS